MTKTILAGALLAAFAASPALAAPATAPAPAPAPKVAPAAPAGDEEPVTRAQMQQTIAGQFAAMDANKDGFVTKEELGDRAGMLERLDANGDGKVALDEVSKRMLGMFDMVDANHDGTVTPAERDAFRQSMRAARAGGAPAGGDQPQP
jgi:hypothetical protein